MTGRKLLTTLSRVGEAPGAVWTQFLLAPGFRLVAPKLITVTLITFVLAFLALVRQRRPS
jgi:hypothetical protein